MSRTLSCRLALGLTLLFAACHHVHDGDGMMYDLSASSTDTQQTLEIDPPNAILMVSGVHKISMQTFTAKLNGVAVDAQWSTDRQELGNFPSVGDPTYSTTGNLGGKATVTAVTADGLVGQASVTDMYVDTGENGDPADPNCTHDTSKENIVGKGGYGGVGGDGPGCAADQAQRDLLNATTPPTQDPTLVWLYPYDQTVWPKGQLAPLLQWDPAAHKIVALKLRMASKGGTYLYEGTFKTPHSAKNGFINMPIPQGVWEVMNQSSAGDRVDVTVTLLADDNKTYAFKTTATSSNKDIDWIIATGVLTGTVYYNSYGTGVGVPASPSTPMTNSGDKDTSGLEFAAGVLGIRPGKTDPVLIAGKNSPGSMSGCRVCHTVSRDGSRLIAQHGDSYQTSTWEDLKQPNPSLMETGFTLNANKDPIANSAFSAIYPDGTLLFTSSSPNALINGDDFSRLYTLPDGQLAKGVQNPPPHDFQAAMPSFAPDGSQLVFNWFGGVGSDMKSLATMTFDASNKKFGDVTKLLTPAGGYTAVWPSFLPKQVGVLYELETLPKEFGNTRNGVQAHLEWVDVASHTEGPLYRLNGSNDAMPYLPTNPNHLNDQELNYEPTVNPVASGGYAWVVFTSRRMYGNVATQDPFDSDPRSYDWRHQITTKKLWVAAIDLNAKAGSDPSHPAFYLPAQELFAGNSRGFWTVDPCKKDGNGCETGDECCGGYCSQSAAGDAGASGVLVCSSVQNGCVPLNGKCSTDADCCNVTNVIDPVPPNECINGYCAQSAPVPIQ